MSTSLKKVAEALQAAQVPTYIVKQGFIPRLVVKASFPNDEVSLGNHIGVKASQEQPKIAFEDIETPKKSYTVLMLDPDAKSRQEPIWSPFMHWATTVSDSGAPQKALFKYMGPAPPEGTGPHRYLLLAYEKKEENEELKTEVQVDDDHRPKFPIEEFVRQNQLELVGCNFFYAENKA